ncbi:MAG: galactosyltransferase-related protein [Steroidobacter sp.]
MSRRILERRVAQPLTFAAGQRLTVVIPFRDRNEHLQQLLPMLRAELERQGVSFGVLVVEQEAGGLFNRGRLINIGVRHAADRTDYYCLHDVDAIPRVANYACPSQPLRLVSEIVTAHGPTARTNYYFSGAVSIRKEQLVHANGYSNEYWGWGKEDDDFFFRLLLAGFLCYFDLQGQFYDLPNPAHQQVERKRFTTPPHVGRNRRRRSKLLRGLVDPAQDGLSTVRYEIADRQIGGGFEKIRVRW